MNRPRLLDRIDPATVLADQRGRGVNFVDAEVDDTWHHDREVSRLGTEAPGPPEPNGVFETACRLVEAYEMADPSIIRAVYDPDVALLGRDMVLEGRFLVLRFPMGVRVTRVVDEDRDGTRVWGWGYETLEGHLERGRMSYLVTKDPDGAVDFEIVAFSEGSPHLGPVVGLGWKLFGRGRQLRFYRACGRRLARFVRQRVGRPDPIPARRAVEGLVLAPSDAR